MLFGVRGFLLASKFWNFSLINLLEFENFIYFILENSNVNSHHREVSHEFVGLMQVLIIFNS